MKRRLNRPSESYIIMSMFRLMPSPKLIIITLFEGLTIAQSYKTLSLTPLPNLHGYNFVSLYVVFVQYCFFLRLWQELDSLEVVEVSLRFTQKKMGHTVYVQQKKDTPNCNCSCHVGRLHFNSLIASVQP